MPTYLIERNIEGIGASSRAELGVLSAQLCAALDELGTSIQWVRSFITEDAVYCTYIARNEEIVREHARRTVFPITRITVIRGVIDPATAESTWTR